MQALRHAMSNFVEVRPEIREALSAARAVVALESTVLTHGLPRPENVEAGRRQVDAVAGAGAVAGTTGVVAGRVIVGLSEAERERLCAGDAVKASSHTLALAAARGRDAGTTVAATVALSARAGIRVVSTGGIGGVHPGGRDVSADLLEISRTPVLVVCSGPKSILDVEGTREALETLSVPVLGWRTDEMPAFFTARSGLPVDAEVESAAEVAAIWRAHRALGRPGGVVLCVPPPRSVPPQELERWHATPRAGVSTYEGSGRTPSALDRVRERSGGDAVRLNLDLLEKNAAVAAAVARALER